MERFAQIVMTLPEMRQEAIPMASKYLRGRSSPPIEPLRRRSAITQEAAQLAPATIPALKLSALLPNGG
jgi:hypothetical protein